MFRNKKILLIGAGNMGQSLIRGWLKHGYKNILAIDPNLEVKKTLSNLEISFHEDIEHFHFDVDVIVIAVKPQVLDEVLHQISMQDLSKTVILSIVAGKKIKVYQEALGDVSIVRSMPNSPSSIGNGMTALCASSQTSEEQVLLSKSLFESVGKVAWVDESMMDIVTAISGSGPAYVFYFIECLISSAVKAGMKEDLARELAIMTVYGSANYALESEQNLQELRERVTSPGGTTEAALEVLTNGDFKDCIDLAINQAKKRSEELN